MYNKLLLKKMLFFYLLFFLKSNCQETTFLSDYLNFNTVAKDLLIARIREVKDLVKKYDKEKTQKYFKDKGISQKTDLNDLTDSYNLAIKSIQEKSDQEITKTKAQALRERFSSRKDIRYSEDWLQDALTKIEAIKIVDKQGNAVKTAIDNLSKKLTKFIASFSNGLSELKTENKTAFEENVDQEFADTFINNTSKKIIAFKDQPEADNEFNFSKLKTGSESEKQELKNFIRRSVTLAKYLFENSDENGKLVIKKNPNNPNDEIIIDLLEFAENNEFKYAFKKVKDEFTKKLKFQTLVNKGITESNKADKTGLKLKLISAEKKQEIDADSFLAAESELKAKTKSLKDEAREIIRNRNAALAEEQASRKGAYSKKVLNEDNSFKQEESGSKTIFDRSLDKLTAAKKEQLAVNKLKYKAYLSADFKSTISEKLNEIVENNDNTKSLTEAEFNDFLKSQKEIFLKKYQDYATIGFKKGPTQQNLEEEIDSVITEYKARHTDLQKIKKDFTIKKANQEITKQGIAQIIAKLDALKVKKAQDLEKQADARAKISKSQEEVEAKIIEEVIRKKTKAELKIAAAEVSIPAKAGTEVTKTLPKVGTGAAKVGTGAAKVGTGAAPAPAKPAPAKPAPAPAKPVKAPIFFLRPKSPKGT